MDLVETKQDCWRSFVLNIASRLIDGVANRRNVARIFSSWLQGIAAVPRAFAMHARELSWFSRTSQFLDKDTHMKSEAI